MKRITRGLVLTALMSIGGMFFEHNVLAEIESKIVHEEKVDVNKIWNVEFTKKFMTDTINNDNIKMYDSTGREIEISFEFVGDKEIRVLSKYPFKPDSRYKISLEGITDTSGEEMEKPIYFEFETKNYNIEDSKEMIGWEMAKFKDSYNFIIDDEDSVINESTKKNLLKSISPSTFYFDYEDGKINGLKVVKNKNYIEKLRENKYENLPMVHVVYDSSVNKSEKSFQNSVLEFFNNETLEDEFIKNLVEEIKSQNSNRVVLDFEGLDKDNREGFTQFISKIKRFDESIEIMVCVAYPKDNYLFNFIDIDSIKADVDGFIFMAYNQTGIGERTPGPIASNRWVKKGLEKFIELGVPSDKLILGMPTYNIDFATVTVNAELDSVVVVNRYVNGEEAMLYEDENKTNVIKKLTYGDAFVTQDYKNGMYKVQFGDKSAYVERKFIQWVPAGETNVAVGWEILTQKKTHELINQSEGDMYYDEKYGQNIFTYYKYDRAKTVKLEHKIWVEDETALQWKFKIVEELDLKGIAIWRLGYEKQNILNK